MAKKTDLKNSFSTSRKAIEKPTLEDIERITATVEKSPIVDIPLVKEKPASAPEEAFIKTSLDFPKTMYREMKIRLLDKEQSMKEYIWELIRKDLQGNK